MSLPSGKIILINRIIYSYPIEINGKELTDDLLEIDMWDFSMDCNKKAMTFQSPNFKRFIFFW